MKRLLEYFDLIRLHVFKAPNNRVLNWFDFLDPIIISFHQMENKYVRNSSILNITDNKVSKPSTPFFAIMVKSSISFLEDLKTNLFSVQPDSSRIYRGNFIAAHKKGVGNTYF